MALDTVGGSTRVSLYLVEWAQACQAGDTDGLRQPPGARASCRSLCCLPSLLQPGTDARAEAIPSALSSLAQGPSLHGSPELRGQSLQLETGNSMRVTPTCKTDDCIDKTGSPQLLEAAPFLRPCLWGQAPPPQNKAA